MSVWRTGVAALALVAALAWLAGGPGLVGGEPVRVGAVAPEFLGEGPWIGGKPLTMASLRGRVVLLEFWTLG